MTSKVSRGSPGWQVLEEASEWFVDFRTGDVDAAAQAQFDQWLRRSPENIQAYLEITETWADLPVTKPSVDIAALVANARRQANVVSMERASPRRVRRETAFPRRRALIAACATLAVAVVASVYWLNRAAEYSTGVGEQRFVTLTDGSTLQLNTRTRLTVRFTDRERRIDLVEGQALFTAAKDAVRPFIVNSNGARIRAVGTQFDIYRKAGGTVLTVVEGQVTIGDGPLLGAGDQATITPTSIRRASAVDVSGVIAWTQRRLVFNATPLTEVAEEFNRYNFRQLTIEGESLKHMRISGTYTSTDPASLLNFLRDDPDVRVTVTNTQIRISRR